VNKPGVYEVPLGYNMLKSIEVIGGGIPGGKKLKSLSRRIVLPDFEGRRVRCADGLRFIAAIGSMLGSGGMVVMDETTDMVKVALRDHAILRARSCGWCIPCREGTTWLRKILQRFDDGGGRREDIALLGELSHNMLGRTFCALGDAAAMPTISIVEKFAGDFEKRLAREAVLV
jgi:NADH-quinone oxidoreductase subunit F